MAIRNTSCNPYRKRGFDFVCELVALGIAISLLKQVEGFVVQPTSPKGAAAHPIAENHRSSSSSSSFLESTKSGGANTNATSIPFFVDPPGDAASEESEPRRNSRSGSRTVGAEEASLFPGLLKLASMHCASQALNTAVKLKIPDFLGHQQMSVDELAVLIETSNNRGKHEFEELPCHRDALFRTLRLLTTIDVVKEERSKEPESFSAEAAPLMSHQSSFRFSLTPLGRSLMTPSSQTTPGMASCVLHWMEEPLWDSWLELPDYIREGGFEDKNDTLLPFERANGAVSSDDYYNTEDHPESLKQANNFVRLIHDHELHAVTKSFDWSQYKHQRLVDVAGNNGKLASAIAESEPDLQCSCLDLPSVIQNVPQEHRPHNVKLVPGNVLDPDTIPDCEIILMKHFCDRCMWFDDQTVEILRSCKTVLERSGTNSKHHHHHHKTQPPIQRRVLIADAVLPDCGAIDAGNQLPLYLDAMYMLVGRERQRTRSEWKALAEAAGLRLSGVIDTGVPSCSLIVLEPEEELPPQPKVFSSFQ